MRFTKNVSWLALALGLATSAQAAPGRKVMIQCTNPGTHQDVAKTPTVKNTSSANIAATKKVYWKATDGDSGSFQGPLAKGASKKVIGSAGNGYQCSAYYYVNGFALDRASDEMTDEDYARD